MKKIWIALAGISLASLACSEAQATIFNFDVQYWDGVGEPTSTPAEEDFAHFVVDDYCGGTISNHGHPTGIWTTGHGDYFGLYTDADIDIDVYNDYWGGGFTFTPFNADGDPDFDYMLDIEGPSVLGGTPGDYHIQAGTYDYDYYGYGAFRVTITEAEAGPAALPEPAAWMMIVVGFGAMGAAMRHRQRTSIIFG